MKKEEIKKLFDDETFMAELHKVNSMETLQSFLANKGVCLSLPEMNAAIRKGTRAELTEAELACVSAGSALNWVKIAWDCFMFNLHTEKK